MEKTKAKPVALELVRQLLPDLAVRALLLPRQKLVHRAVVDLAALQANPIPVLHHAAVARVAPLQVRISIVVPLLRLLVVLVGALKSSVPTVVLPPRVLKPFVPKRHVLVCHLHP